MELGVALVWGWALVTVALLAKGALGDWIRHQRFLAELGIAKQPVVQHVPRGTYQGATVPQAANGPPAHARDVGLPDDLEAYIGQWDESWARDDEAATIRAKYLELYTGDPGETWQKVRRAVGIGEIP